MLNKTALFETYIDECNQNSTCKSIFTKNSDQIYNYFQTIAKNYTTSKKKANLADSLKSYIEKEFNLRKNHLAFEVLYYMTVETKSE